jgi:poly-gamma-glutamate capsule biosynthesis protein CapA/YwtB (metallophosphatase superfamily)
MSEEEKQGVFDAIARVRHQVDMVVFSFHWGPNYRWIPSASFRNFAHELIEHVRSLLVTNYPATYVNIYIYIYK